MYMYLPSPYIIYNIHVCTMHVHTYYIYIHIQYVSTVHVLHMYRLCGCAGIFMALYAIFFALGGTFLNIIMYTECTPILAPR